jgi:hypothetical protein
VRDAILFPATMVAFATCVTAIVAIAWTLFFRPPRWRGFVALFVPPSAPYFAFREGMRVRAWLAIGAALLYAVLRTLG